MKRFRASSASRAFSKRARVRDPPAGRTVGQAFHPRWPVVRLAIARLPDRPTVVEVYRNAATSSWRYRPIRHYSGLPPATQGGGKSWSSRGRSMVQMQGLQNPIVLHYGAGPVVDEICRWFTTARPQPVAIKRLKSAVLGSPQLFGDHVRSTSVVPRRW